jgi:hypothetical protein
MDLADQLHLAGLVVLLRHWLLSHQQAPVLLLRRSLLVLQSLLLDLADQSHRLLRSVLVHQLGRQVLANLLHLSNLEGLVLLLLLVIPERQSLLVRPWPLVLLLHLSSLVGLELRLRPAVPEHQWLPVHLLHPLILVGLERRLRPALLVHQLPPVLLLHPLILVGLELPLRRSYLADLLPLVGLLGRLPRRKHCHSIADNYSCCQRSMAEDS